MSPISRISIFVLIVAGAGVWFSLRPNQDVDESDGSSQQEAQNSQVADDKELSLANRKYIWDIEHLAFLLEQKVFPDLKRGIAKSDISTVKRLLASDCFCQRLLPDWDSAPSNAGIRHASFDKSNAELSNVDPSEFLNDMTKIRGRAGSSTDCQVGIGILQLAPTDSHDLDGEWKSRWLLRLAGNNESARTEIVCELSLTLSELHDEIHEASGWVREIRMDRISFVQGPSNAYLVDVTQKSGLHVDRLRDNWKCSDFMPNTGGVYVNDFNLDTHLDLLVDDRQAGWILYRGNGDGTFEGVTESAGLGGLPSGEDILWTASCFADLDNDGDEDLIAQDRVFENLGDGTFKDRTEQTKLSLVPTSSYAIADFDADGLVDIYACHTSAYRPGQEANKSVKWIDGGLGIDNVLWRNSGDWSFEDVTEATSTGGSGSSTFAAAWLDANDDGRLDLLAINEFGRNSLMIQGDDHKFSERRIDPVFGGFSMGVTTGDLNNDGRDDVYVANMYSKAGTRIIQNVDRTQYAADLFKQLQQSTTGNRAYLSRGNGEFDVIPSEQMPAGLGWTYGPAICDLNADGLLDVYSTAGFKSVQRGKPDG